MTPKTLFVLLLLGGELAAAAAAPITIPFRMVRNLMVVHATVNGQTGNFIFDTGQPGIVLNARYFTGRPVLTGDCGGFQSLVGTTDACVVAPVQLHVADLTIRDRAPVVDLYPLEAGKRMNILGLLGAKAFRAYEIVLDFDRQVIELHPLDRHGNRREATGDRPPDAALTFRFVAHLPYVTTHLPDQSLRLALDTGVEVNILSTGLRDAFHTGEHPSLPKRLVTPGGGSRPVVSAWVRAVRIPAVPLLPAMETIFLPLDDLNRLPGPDLDGILGLEFLQYFRTALNYKKKTIYLWQQKERILAAIQSGRNE